MKVLSASEVAPREVNADGQSTRKGSYPGQRLFTEDAADGLNFIFVRNQFIHTGAGAFETPRHRHTFAQVKFVEKGASNYGPEQFIEEGEIAYFPRMAYYGPQLQENCTSNVIQFGFHGEHQKGPVWEGYRARALEQLKARGAIENGKYVDIDPTTGERRVQDGVEAVYKEQYRMHTGRDLVAREVAYDSVIHMRPAGFAWADEAPGVQVRRLGRFFDEPGPQGDVAISMLRLSDGGAYALGADRAQLAWTLKGGLIADGQHKSGFASVFSPLGEETELSGGQDGVEVYVVQFPRPAPAFGGEA